MEHSGAGLVLRDCAPGYPPHPIVDLAKGRDAALEAYRRQRERVPADG